MEKIETMWRRFADTMPDCGKEVFVLCPDEDGDEDFSYLWGHGEVGVVRKEGFGFAFFRGVQCNDKASDYHHSLLKLRGRWCYISDIYKAIGEDSFSDNDPPLVIKYQELG